MRDLLFHPQEGERQNYSYMHYDFLISSDSEPLRVHGFPRFYRKLTSPSKLLFSCGSAAEDGKLPPRSCSF